MENIDKPKIKTIFKNENRLNNPSLKGDKNESDSSDSNILEDSSDFETNEDRKTYFGSKNNGNDQLLQTHTMTNIKSLANDISKSVKNIFSTTKTIKKFSDEDNPVKSSYETKNKNVINEIKDEKKKDSKNNKKVKIKEKDDIKDKDKDNIKIFKDFFVNKEGDNDLASYGRGYKFKRSCNRQQKINIYFTERIMEISKNTFRKSNNRL